MSFDKFPLKIAMEALADDSAPQAPVLKTAEDLLVWISTYPGLGKAQRSNEVSAIRALGTVDSTPLSAIPIEERYLLDDRYKAIRADKSRNKKRRNNIITILNRILKRAGIIKVGSRRSGKTTVAWTKLLTSLSNRNDEYGLNTLALYCSGKNIEPHGVTLDVWQGFVDETLKHSAFRRPRATVGRAVIASNRARARFSHWPLPQLPRLVNPRQFSLSKDSFRPSFWADLDAYVERSSTFTGDIFDKNRAKVLSPDTLVRYREVAWRMGSAQVHMGRPADEIVDLKALLDLHWAKEGMRYLHRRAGNKFLKDHLNIAATMVSFARNYVRPGKADTKALRKIMDLIAKELGPAEFSQRNIDKLDQFNDAETALEFQLMSFRIFDEVRQKKEITIEDARLMMAAVAHELLLATMVRLKNLTFIDLKTNFWPAKPKPDGTWVFRVKGETVKNNKDLDFKLSKHTTRLIEFYLKECRPLLIKSMGTSPTSDLFPVNHVTDKGRIKLAYLIVSTVGRRLGLDVNAHLYRHIGALLFLEKQTGALEVVRIMLGHKDIRTTERFYARLKATQAIQFFTEVVFGGRDAMIQELRLGARRK
jgi:integrase